MKYIDADRFKAEIDKRYAEYRAKMKTDDFTYYEGMADALDLFEQFIDSLQQEQPCDTCTNDKGCVTCKDGELWEGKEQPSKDLEKEIQRYLREECSSDDEPSIGEIARHFANWQKEQILKDAVEGYVNYYEDSGGILMAEAQVGCPYHNGDKAKIVIIPNKEDKK